MVISELCDEGRIGGLERQHAMVCQISRLLEFPAKDSGHDLAWGWPLLGLSDPNARVTHRSLSSHRLTQGSNCIRVSKETADDTHWKGNAQGQERAPFRRRRQSEIPRTGDQRRKGQRRRGKLRLERDLREDRPAYPLDCTRHQSGWPMFFALLSSFFRETGFTKFDSEEIVTARSRHNSRRRRIPMPVSPRHRARCNRHEERAGIAVLVSCCLVRLSNGSLDPPDEIALSSPSCTWRSICRGAAFASRLDKLTFSGDKRDRSKALFFAVHNGTSISDPEAVNFSYASEN